MKITKYVFNNVEYNEMEMVTLTFQVKLNNIERFIKEVAKVKNQVRNERGIGYFVLSEIKDIFSTSSRFDGKIIEIRTYAYIMYNIMLKLGVKEHQTVLDNIIVNQHKLVTEKVNLNEWVDTYVIIDENDKFLSFDDGQYVRYGDLEEAKMDLAEGELIYRVSDLSKKHKRRLKRNVHKFD